MKFKYTAINSNNSKVEGTMEALNRQSAVSTLTKQGLKPLTVNPVSGGAQKKKRMSGVKLKDMVIFTRQLATMVSAGVPLTRALTTLQLQTDNKNFQVVIAAVIKDVESGIALGDAFAKHPGVFSEVYVNMVRAGEAGGILDDILKRLANQVEMDSSMRKKIKSAATYPTVLMIITILAFFGIMLFVLPTIGEIIKDLGGPDAELPPYTLALLALSDFMLNNAILMFLMLGSGVYGIKKYISTPKGKINFHKLLLRIPILKTLVLKIAIARFARTFASLMSAGVSVLDALEITASALGNRVIEKELRLAAIEVRNGKQLSEPLSTSPHFPKIVPQMIAIGEETGQIDTILIKVADFYEEEVGVMVDSLSSIIEPLMIVVLGGMVGLIAASVMGPIASLSQNIGG
jgi:type IV pilus assembly protein PilC